MSKDKYLLSTAAGVSDDLIEIGGEEFKATAMTLKESDTFKSTYALEDSIGALVPVLKARHVGEGEITEEFLKGHITKPFLRQLLQILVNGKILDDNPKA